MSSYLTPIDTTRRALLRRCGALGLLGGATPLALNLAAIGQAAALTAPADDYKALVCLFMSGGNDAFNTVLATDAASWQAYSTVRNQQPDSIALLAAGTPADASAVPASPARLGGVRAISPLRPQGRSLALHPLLTGLAQRFDSDKRVAIVANVGALLQPTSKSQYASASYPKPAKLFSHNDQTSFWQALAGEGARSGWGGRMADVLLSGNRLAMFTAVSTSGSNVWLAGDQVRPYQTGSTGAIRIGTSGIQLYGSAAAYTAMQQIMRNPRSGHLLERDHSAVVGRSMDAYDQLASALPAAEMAPWGTPSAGYSQTTDPLLGVLNPRTGVMAVNPLAQQLQMVARHIAARTALGMRRQVFMVNLGDFDTHETQNGRHAHNMARLDHALSYFDATLQAMGVGSQVTTFTASEFGRSFTSNGDGTDHGWGAHHFVMGGAVKGGDVYGRLPVIGPKNSANNDFDSSPDQLRNGVLLPEVSIDQFAATLAGWFGLSAAQTLTLLPRLAGWNASLRNLGFMA